MLMKKPMIAAMLALSVVMSGCATTKTAGTYSTSNVMQRANVTYGYVIAVRDVQIENDSTGVGASAGAGVGAIAGSNIGGGRGSWIGAIAGAVVGGIAGNAAERSLNGQEGVEITYRDESNGKTYSLVQQVDPSNPIAVGSRIRILDNGRTVRAVLDS